MSHAHRTSGKSVPILGSAALHLALLAAAALALGPFAWMLCAAFKQPGDVFRVPLLPWDHLHDLTLANFRTLLHTTPFGRWVLNSLFVASLQTALVVTFSALGGFALAKYRFAGKKLLMALMLLTMLLPGLILLPGGYLLMYDLGWIDSYAAIIVPGSVSVFGILLFRQAMLRVPDDLLHAGRVDGASELRIWWEIALPVVRPMLGAYTLLSFLAAWNSYLWPQIMLQDQTRYTLPIGLAGMLSLPEFQTQYGVLMAGTLLSVLPVMMLFFALQKDFVSGLSTGALKG
jgi:ABC-type glycerol-3-phosphate transport system permease component